MDTAPSRLRQLIPWLLLAAAVAALAWLLLRQRPEAAPSGLEPEAHAARGAGRDADSVPSSAVDIKQWSGAEPPLPPVDAPFGDVFAELKRRADLGQPKAACRLAFELDRCQQAKEQLFSVDAAIRNVQSLPAPSDAAPADRKMIQNGRDDALRQFNANAETLLHDVEQCDSAGAVPPQQRTRYWRTAALAGHLPSMAHYAVGNGFRWNNVLNDLPGLSAYRREAEPLARRAAASGDLDMTLVLAAAYASDSKNQQSRNFLKQLLPADDVESVALYQRASFALDGDKRPEASLLRDAIQARARLVRRGMSSIEQSEAGNRAQDLQRDWSSVDTSTLPSSNTITNGNLLDIDAGACGTDRFVAH